MSRVKIRLTYLFALSATAFIFSVSACSAEAPLPFTPIPTSTPPVGVRALLAKQEAWQQLAIREYQFNLKWQEAGGPEHAATIRVENGIPTVLAGELPPGAPTTIDELFEWIREELKESSSWTTVHYDDRGFPLWGRFEAENSSPDQRHRFTIENMALDEFVELQLELDEAKAKWESHAFSDYTFDIEIWDNFNLAHPSPIRVVVEGRTVSDHFRVDLDRSFAYNIWNRTIDELLDVIQRYINEPVDLLTVKFDEEFGYPLEIRVDGDASITDDELTYVVTRFQPISDQSTPPN